MTAPAFLSKVIADANVLGTSNSTTRVRTISVSTATPAGSLVVLGILNDTTTGSMSTAADAVTDSSNNTYTVVGGVNSGLTASPGYVALAFCRLTYPLTTSSLFYIKSTVGSHPTFVSGVAFSNLLATPVGTATRTELDSYYASGSADNGNQFIAVAPSAGTSGYAIGLVGTWNQYSMLETTAAYSTTRLVNLFNSTSTAPAAVQFELGWKSSKVTASTNVGVSINNNSVQYPSTNAVGYHAVGIILPEFSAGSSYEQSVEMF